MSSQSMIVIDDSICEKISIGPQWFEKNDGIKRERAKKNDTKINVKEMIKLRTQFSTTTNVITDTKMIQEYDHFMKVCW